MGNKLKQIKVTIKGEDLDEILQGLNVVIAELQAGNVAPGQRLFSAAS